jgi:hypothetical protein
MRQEKLIDGAAFGNYPYPSIDAAQLGFARVWEKVMILLAFFFAPGAGVTAIDRARSPAAEGAAGLARQPNSDK